MKRRRWESNLHWDIIYEILLRLPVKSLVRFKCVCKSWLSLISDPHFAKSHYNLSASPSHKLLLIERSGSETRSLDVDAFLHTDASVILRPPKPGKRPSLEILGSCRGFLFIERYPNLYLLNPSVGFLRDLSYFEIGQEHHNEVKPLIGFGYDPSTDNYLIVVLFSTFNNDDMADRLVIFSLRTNSLKEIQMPHIPFYYSENQSLLFNDAIHWLAYGENRLKVILAFDLIKENFYEISLPDGDFTIGFSFCNLGTMGGCLCLCQFDRSKTIVWIMKKYKLQSSWIMIEIARNLSAACMAKGGELVALSFDDGELMKFNDKGQFLERCEYYFDDLSGFEVAAYTESLLSLPMKQPQKNQIRRNRNA
ncbi:F-box/kelch-repeat protein At3g06240-like [Gastrolobium bilobum]|uniref:F-box/kelch-repeat protein At3g06240-like n=1 Tax=Gastrolobium bilobum TaxID=150636 RepID=UPI002AB1F959|nr:F-box/kelch-repeat protein At3g06240-like [Gastrolobium bilobum]